MYDVSGLYPLSISMLMLMIMMCNDLSVHVQMNESAIFYRKYNIGVI